VALLRLANKILLRDLVPNDLIRNLGGGGPTINPSEVKFLANFNGADQATAYTSEDAGLRVATFGGNLKLVTAEKKFGTSSLWGDGGFYISFPSTTDLDITAGDDWTLESWVKATNFGVDAMSIASLPLAWNCEIWTTGTYGNMRCGVYETNGSTIDDNTTHTLEVGEITNNDWNFISYSKVGTSLHQHINGVLIQTTTVQDAGLRANTHGLRVGQFAITSHFVDGWIDSMRYIVGTGLYTADSYAVPTEALTDGT